MANWSRIHLTTLPALRLDPEYYQPDYLALAEQLATANPLAISDFADVTDGIHDSPDWVDGEGVICLSAKCVKDNEIVLDVAGQISQFQNAANPRTQARLDDVLISSVGTIGNAAVVDESVLPANTDRHLGIIRIRDKQAVDPYYLSTFLNCRYGRFQSLRESTGNVQLNLFIDKIKQLRVPVGPSFNEVSQLTRQAYALRQESKRLYGEAEQMLLDALGVHEADLATDLYGVSRISEACGAGRLDAEFFEGKYTKTLNYLINLGNCEQLGQIGKVMKGRSVEYLESGAGIPVIRSGDLIDLDSVSELKQADPNQQMFILQVGDVCISSIGLGSIGKVQTFDKAGKYATVSEVTVLRQKRLNPYFLQIFLQSRVGQLQIERWVTGATGQQHLYPRDVEKIIVPILADDVQNRIEAKVLQSRRAKIEAQQILERAKLQVERLIAEVQ